MAIRLPPYGREFAQARRKGLIPRRLGFGHIVVNLEWREPSAAHPFICIPPGSDPASFDLTFVAGLHVTVSHNDRQAHRVPALVDALLVAGADRVDAANRDGLARGDSLDEAWPVFKREQPHG